MTVNDTTHPGMTAIHYELRDRWRALVGLTSPTSPSARSAENHSAADDLPGDVTVASPSRIKISATMLGVATA